jgi:glycosyltransferase 2 family protein
MRKALSLLAKATISGLLLYLALNLVNLGTVAARLRQIKPEWVALSVLVLGVQMILLTVRWKRLVVHCGADLSLARLFRFTVIAAFFNQTLPSSVGGDAMRIWLLGKQSNWRVASYSVLLDRVIGVVALAIIVALCLPWTFQLVHDPVGRSALLVIGLGSIVGWCVFLALGWQRLHILQRWTPTRHLAATATVAADILRSPGAVVPIFLLSELIHVLTALAAWCVAHSIDADLSFLNALFLVLPVVLVAVVPISIAGWGVREGAMVAAFAYAGLPQSDGLLVSILFGVSYLVLGALGGLVWVFNSQQPDVSVVSDSVTRG